MIGRTPGNIVAVRPLRQGVISDFEVTEKMLKYFISKAIGKRAFRKPRISICAPSGITEVEKKAVEEATYQAGAREVSIIEEPYCSSHRSRDRHYKAFWKYDRGYRGRHYRCGGNLPWRNGSLHFH